MHTARATSFALVAAFVLSSLPSLIAQERPPLTSTPPRTGLRPLLGKVVDAQGNGVARASVHLALIAAGSESGETSDYQVATTDGRGRFRFQAQPCSRHRIWATQTAATESAVEGTFADGRVSDIIWASAGSLVELRLDKPAIACRLTIKNTEAWPNAGPFRVRIAPGAISLATPPIALDASHECTLPIMPSGQAAIDILDKHGQPLQCTTLGRIQKKQIVKLSPPRTVPMKVCDKDGKPIAGATVRQRFQAGWSDLRGFGPRASARRRWRELGQTDAKGQLRAQIANDQDPFESSGWPQLFFVASKDGYNISHSGFTDEPFVDGIEIDRTDLEELRFTLRPAKPAKLRLMLDKDRPLARQHLAIVQSYRIQEQDGNSSSHEDYTHSTTTDEHGQVLIPDLTEPVGKVRVLFGDGPQRSELVSKKLQRMLPQGGVALHRLSRKEGEQEIVIGSFPKLQLQLLDATGGPASDAELLFVSIEHANDYECDAWTPTTTTDAAGRVVMLLQPGNWLVFARDGLGMAHAKIDIDADEQLQMRMEPMPVMRGKVVDGDGKPVAGARLSCHSSSWTSRGRQDAAIDAVAQTMNWSWISNTVSDAEGNFACTFLDLPNMTYKGRFKKAGKKSDSLKIQAGEDPMTVRLQ